MSRGILLYSKLDFSPRAICEGVWAGLPYVTHESVAMPERLRQFGHFCHDKDPVDFNEQVFKITSFNDHIRIHEYCKKNLTLFDNYSKIINDINNEYKNLYV